MKRSLIQNLSVNIIQLITNQVAALVLFYVMSIGLDKNGFGQINLSLAVLLTVFSILSFGIDQIAVKKIASGVDPAHVFSLYAFHVLLTGLGFYIALFAGYCLFPNHVYSLVLLMGIGKLMMFFATPFKQLASGLERFKLLAYMSVISNVLRGCVVVALFLFKNLNVYTAVMAFIIGDTAELICGAWLFKWKTATPLVIKWNIKAYRDLLLESLPQTGVVLINSALARFDWIFIGFILSAVKLAEYSFAYKAFEISTLPLLAIAPLLVPKFTKFIQNETIPEDELKTLVRVEMILASLTILLLNICWAPIVDGITKGKYGSVNITTIFILSLCIPFLYLNNFLWSVYFAQGKLKMILRSFIITLLVNVVGDIILIPIYKNEGAAFAFLLACFVQSIFYLRKNSIRGLGNIWHPLLPCIICALVGGFASRMLFPGSWAAVPVALVIYLILLIVLKQARLSDREKLINLLKL